MPAQQPINWTSDAISAGSAAAGPAHAFWMELAAHDRVSRALRAVAREMSQRIRPR